jgi:dethiobiotin synthetase
VFAAGLAGALGARYWKPVQSGLEDETDSQTVARLSGLPSGHILPEAYRLTAPLSPHLSARLDGVEIDIGKLLPPQSEGPLVIEGAGGLLVPLTATTVFAEVFAQWRIPVILCARTALGTINHTLLSLEALRRRAIPVCGVAFIGPENANTQATIATIGQVDILGRLPMLDNLTRESLAQAFRENFDTRLMLENCA